MVSTLKQLSSYFSRLKRDASIVNSLRMASCAHFLLILLHYKNLECVNIRLAINFDIGGDQPEYSHSI